MTTNNNFSCLPFYKSLDEQHANKEYAFGRAYPLLCPNKHLLPFVIFRQKRSSRTFTIRMYNVKGVQKYDLSGKISGIKVVSYDDFDVIHYSNDNLFPVNTTEGFYYLSLSDGTETWYSDIFQLITDNKTLCLEWWDSEDLHFSGGLIPYSDGFVNRLYFDSKVGKPEYNFNEEGEERDGVFFPTSQLSEKVYKFSIIAPEYLCDVMRTIRMSDYIRITSEGRTYNADQFLCNVDWQEQGDLASVTCEFQTDTIVKKIGKGFVLSN